jgi:proteasome lid subunit RPN8/RPN11
MPQVEESSTDQAPADAAADSALPAETSVDNDDAHETDASAPTISDLLIPHGQQPDVQVSAPTDDQPSEPPPDAGSLIADEWPYRELAVERNDRKGYQAVVRQSALNQIHRHGAETDVEVCGVLVGNVYRDDAGPYLYISDIIRGDQATGRSTQVTFTADTWTHIQTTMDQKFAEQRIVGWYHTHPSFGIFLSGMDLFIQENFFNLSWQVALVYDPIGGDEGIFYWRQGHTEREPFLIDADEPAISADPPKQPVGDEAEPGETRHAPLWLLALTGFLTSFSVTYFLLMFFSRPPVPTAQAAQQTVPTPAAIQLRPTAAPAQPAPSRPPPPQNVPPAATPKPLASAPPPLVPAPGGKRVR